MRDNVIFIIENLFSVLKLFAELKFLLYRFLKCSFKKIYRVQSTKFNISTATVGRINQNGIVTFGKTSHLPHAGTALICTVINKGYRCSGGKALISLFRRLNFRRTRTVGKKLQAIKFARQYRISHCKIPLTELFLIFIMYLFLSSKSLPFYRVI